MYSRVDTDCGGCETARESFKGSRQAPRLEVLRRNRLELPGNLDKRPETHCSWAGLWGACVGKSALHVEGHDVFGVDLTYDLSLCYLDQAHDTASS